MAFTGMNIEAVRNMARQMEQAAAEVEQIATRLTGLLENTEWVGTDATNFRAEWQGTHAPNARQMCERLRMVGQEAERNAQEQEAASS